MCLGGDRDLVIAPNLNLRAPESLGLPAFRQTRSRTAFLRLAADLAMMDEAGP